MSPSAALPVLRLAACVLFVCGCSSSTDASRAGAHAGDDAGLGGGSGNGGASSTSGGASNADGGRASGGSSGVAGAAGGGTAGTDGGGNVGSGGTADSGGDCPCSYVPPASGWVDRCPPYPSFPDETCTGPTTSGLPLYTGSLEFRTDGQVVENVEMQIPSGLYVPADDVTFRNVKLVYTGALDADFTMVNLNYNTGTLFENCEFDGQGKVARAITGSAVTVRNCHIHDVGNGVETETPMIVEGNYIHDIYEPAGTDWHADGIQTGLSSGNVVIRHNTIFGRDPATSAINVMGTLADPAKNVLIQHNLLAGGGYTLYTGPGTDYCVIDNHLSTQFSPKVGGYNIWYWEPSEDGDVTRCGNVLHETGADANQNL